MAQQRIAPTLFCMLLLSMWVPADDLQLPAWGEQARYAIFLALSGWVILNAYIQVGLRLPSGIEAILLTAFLFYMALSCLWGVHTTDSYIKAILVLNALMATLAIASTLSLEDSLRVIFTATATFTVICVIVALAFPSIGVDATWEHAGKWRGLTGQKNMLAADAAFALISGIGLPLKRRRTPLGQWLGLGGRTIIVLIAFVALIMAGSRGGLMIAAIGVVSLMAARLPKAAQSAALLTLLMFSLPILYLAVSTFLIEADKISVVGLTVDTNSRMKIWSYGFRELAGREIFGFGLDSFWTDDRLATFKGIYGWVLDNFHNGYITVIIEGGIAGIMLFLAMLATVYLLLILSIGEMKDRFTGLSFALVNMYVINNLVENQIGRSTSLLLFIFLIIVFSLRAHVWNRLTSDAEKLIRKRRHIENTQIGRMPIFPQMLH